MTDECKKVNNKNCFNCVYSIHITDSSDIFCPVNDDIFPANDYCEKFKSHKQQFREIQEKILILEKTKDQNMFLN